MTTQNGKWLVISFATTGREAPRFPSLQFHFLWSRFVRLDGMRGSVLDHRMAIATAEKSESPCSVEIGGGPMKEAKAATSIPDGKAGQLSEGGELPYFEINSNLQSDDRSVLHIFSRCSSRFPAQLITPHRFGDRSQRYRAAPDRQRPEMPESFCASPRSIATRAKPAQYDSSARPQLLLFLPAQIAFEV